MNINYRNSDLLSTKNIEVNCSLILPCYVITFATNDLRWKVINVLQNLSELFGTSAERTENFDPIDDIYQTSHRRLLTAKVKKIVNCWLF